MCVVSVIFGQLHDEGYMDTFKNEVVKLQRFFEIFTPQNLGGNHPNLTTAFFFDKWVEINLTNELAFLKNRSDWRVSTAQSHAAIQHPEVGLFSI